jgi:biotin operon repressor
MSNKAIAIELLQERFVSKYELMEILHLPNRQVRKLVQDIKKDYPVISTSNHEGYKIATAPEDLPLVLDSIKNNRSKAISIFVGIKQLKMFAAKYGEDGSEQLTLEF